MTGERVQDADRSAFVPRYASVGEFRGQSPPDAADPAGSAGRRLQLGAAQPLHDNSTAAVSEERASGSGRSIDAEWPLYEVFVRAKRGLNHVHVGSLHAPDDELALRHARDVYTRRNEGVSIWVVRSDAITASSPDEKDPLFAPSGDKVYRHPSFYDLPDDVPHM